MSESTLRRPLVTVGVTIIAALAVLLSAFTLLARGTFTSSRITDTLPSGWVVAGVRAPEGAGGVVTLLSVGGPKATPRQLELDAAAPMLRDNDPNGLSQAVADATSLPMAGAMVLDRLALAALVDVVDGLDLQIERPFDWVTTDGEVNAVEAGERHLRGLTVSAYVLADPTGRSLQQVMHALITALPSGHEQLVGIVKSLGMSMRATVSAATVVRWLEFWQSSL